MVSAERENLTPTDDGDEPDRGAPDRLISDVGSAHLARVREAMEVELGRHLAQGEGQGMAVMGGDGLGAYRDHIFTEILLERPWFTLAWPDHLYIPGQADHRPHWIVPPPDDHRYRYAYADGSGASTADAGTGRLFSWVNVSGLNPAYTGFAGVGAAVRPAATLAYLTVGADVDLLAETRWWYLPGPAAGYSTFRYRGTAYVAVWAIDPVSGAWELLRPYGARTLFAFDERGQGGTAVDSRRHAFDDVRATVQVQGGRRYAVTVSFEATITYDCRDRGGRPYVKAEGDDIRLWASIAGSVPSISATTKVLVP